MNADKTTNDATDDTADKLYFLGPQGSFTHQAALMAQRSIAGRHSRQMALEACEDVPFIIDAVQQRRGWGVIAWENNVEGYVMPNLDALIDARDVAGLGRVGVDVAFDAFTRDGRGPFTQLTAHPHGLAQCKGFARSHGLTAVPASSNAAACRDVGVGQVALGPSCCGEIYGLRTLERGVQDFKGARTDFLVLAPRGEVASLASDGKDGEFETILTVIPLSTGPGVVARLLDRVRDEGLNMTSLISRPIKGHTGTYGFVITLDAAPWQPRFRDLLRWVVGRGDWVKTLAVYPRVERPNPPVSAWMLPHGGVCSDRVGEGVARKGDAREMERELLW
ncbi:prephenate dehydratase domain-containing protein [Bifidobacterium sp. ESL0763]|uniref:prephenate dehydratase domain-containing protein n=1 Tax=Bifidobacterium sp. ESL0763 TaxID=2983227 RepID=UPI0023F6DDC5|nr:prephenate dehydratase domain-containing protein [Bifidobacterium sp. ESL0763]MDF7664107.1 prephenate dehydratase domain-containing protein [Bifidobacterium sp. ESL0763]